MAEALLRHHAPQRFETLSAGMEPRPIHPLTLQVLQERGIDTGPLRSKHVSELLGRISATYAIVVCEQAHRRCPAFALFAMNMLYWPFEDPAAATGSECEKLACFRRVRDEIEARIVMWLGLAPGEVRCGTPSPCCPGAP